MARIIEDVDLALKVLEIFCLVNGATVEGISDRNGHIRKLLGEGRRFSWGCSRTKGKGLECEIAKKMFLQSYLLNLCLKKNTTSLSSPLTQLCFTIRKNLLQGNGVKRWRAINQSNNNIHKFDLRQTLPKYARIFLTNLKI